MDDRHIIIAKLPGPGGFQTMYYNPDDRHTAWSPDRAHAKEYFDEGLAKAALRGFDAQRLPRERLEVPLSALDTMST